MRERGKVFVCEYTSWQDSVDLLLDQSGLPEAIDDSSQVLIKPNLVKALDPPITTPVGLVEAIVRYLQDRVPDLKLIVGEGCGIKDYDTFHTFRALGYDKMAERCGVELLDLNVEPLQNFKRSDCKRWPEMHLPTIVMDSFLLSVPVLKAHSLANVTLTMKNMMGCAPPSHYQRVGHWKKAAFHDNVQDAVLDLNRYRTPDFTVLDATVGMQESHLWGPTCEPPHRKLAAGSDPVAIDTYGAGLLGREWRQIGHLANAHGELGLAEPLKVVNLS
jgi:uncharacterized protein (DUF362 family)